MGLDANIPETLRRIVGGPEEGGPPGEPFDLRRMVATVWRSRVLLLIAVGIGLLIGFLYLQRTTTLFTARADVLWDSSEQTVVDIAPVASSGVGSDFLLLESQIEIIRSNRLLGKVVDELAIAEHPHFNRFVVPVGDRPLDLAGTALATLDAMGLGFGLGERKPDPTASRQREITIDSMRRHLEISWVDKSYVMRIQASAPEPQLAADLANAIAGAYIVDQLEKKFEATRQATSWLSERVAGLRTDLEAAEQTVEEFSAASDLVSEEALEASARQIKEFRERRRDLSLRLETLAEDGPEINRMAAVGDFGGLARKLRLPEVETLGEAAVTGDPGALARIESLVSQARRQTVQAATRARTQIESLGRTISDLETSLEGRSKALVELRQLEREAEASRLIYESFLSRLKETTVQEGIQQPDARLLSDAWVPSRASSPNKPAILGISAIAGLFFAITIVVLRERMNGTFRTADELEARTGLAVLGSIPMANLPKRKQFLDFLARRPGSSFAEAIRNLRTSVMLANVDAPAQVVMISSGLPAEGKSTTAIALAHISRSLGKSVLIMECDLRRRSFRRYFEIEHNAGLLSVLSGRLDYEEVVHVEPESGLHVLPGEKTPVNAADIFASQRFGEFMTELRRHYDYIIVDTPPVLAVPDARVIAQHCDALVYVVRWNKTLRETVAQGLRAFSQGKARVTGAVLMQVDMRDMARFGYREYSYYRASERYYDT
ncbi:MAG: polysaccharide biosynthesis tyrosine autokinase [Pseudomonadota bacterium]